MRVSLFITCLVDQFHPEVGIGLVAVLRRLGVTCDFPRAQTCCGQPAFNSGCPNEAAIAARQFLRSFGDSETIVVPSGSCAAMAKVYIPSLFEAGSKHHEESLAIAARVHEFSSFLVNVLGVSDVGASFPHRVTYHDSCHLLRELNVRNEPRTLLEHVRGLQYVGLTGAETCCGFGGTFSIKYPDVSAAMGDEKIANLQRSGAEYVVANDTGCLMHLRGMLTRLGLPIRPLHLAEVLAHGASARG